MRNWIKAFVFSFGRLFRKPVYYRWKSEYDCQTGTFGSMTYEGPFSSL